MMGPPLTLAGHPGLSTLSLGGARQAVVPLALTPSHPPRTPVSVTRPAGWERDRASIPVCRRASVPGPPGCSSSSRAGRQLTGQSVAFGPSVQLRPFPLLPWPSTERPPCWPLGRAPPTPSSPSSLPALESEGHWSLTAEGGAEDSRGGVGSVS